jgi:hypothetical protein
MKPYFTPEDRQFLIQQLEMRAALAQRIDLKLEYGRQANRARLGKIKFDPSTSWRHDWQAQLNDMIARGWS